MSTKPTLKSLLMLVGVIIFFTSPLINAQTDIWKAPKIANMLKNPLKGKVSATKEGKKLFDINCFTCHGEKGLGDGVAASALVPKPANLTSEAVQKQSDGAIYYKITKGKNAMISWESTLTNTQRWQLVNYIRELGRKTVTKMIKNKKTKNN